MKTNKASYTSNEVYDIFRMVVFNNTKLVKLPNFRLTFDDTRITQDECRKISNDIKELFDIDCQTEPTCTWTNMYADILGQLHYNGRLSDGIDLQYNQPTPRKKYTKHQIYDILLNKLGNVMKRKIYADQILASMMYYAGLDKSGKQYTKLLEQFRDIQNTFKIKIYAFYTLDDVASLIAESLTKLGYLELDSQRYTIQKQIMFTNTKQK